MPLEIVIDSRKEGKFKGSVYNPMKRMDKAAKAIANHESFSNVLSIAEGFKFVTQAYYRVIQNLTECHNHQRLKE